MLTFIEFLFVFCLCVALLLNLLTLSWVVFDTKIFSVSKMYKLQTVNPSGCSFDSIANRFLPGRSNDLWLVLLWGQLLTL